MDLTREGDVFTLDLGDGVNTFNPTTLGEINGALDEVESGIAGGTGALVVTATGKSWSQGLDLEWIGTQAPETSAAMVVDVHRLYLRMLQFPAYTVAAVNGHAFGGGAMLVLAHDAAFMRADAGWWCLPESSIGLPFTPGMSSLVQGRVPQPYLHRAMFTAYRYTGPEAATAGIVTAALPSHELVPAAHADAAAHANRPQGFLRGTRAKLYERTIADLEQVIADGLTWG